MSELACPRCGAPAVRLVQTGELSCVKQCDETLPEELERRELEGLTVDVARVLRLCIPSGTGFGFTLILSKFGDRGGMAFATTVEREGMKCMLRELLDKLEAGEPTS